MLAAFLSTWSNARATFGQNAPQPGAQYDNSGTLLQLQSDLGSAAPGSRWTGTAASAYDTVNTEHRRVIGRIAELDQRLGAQVDRSAEVVTAGRDRLDAVRQWVLAAAASVPQNAAGERMLVPIVQKGVGDIIDVVTASNSELNAIGAQIGRLGEEYRTLSDQKFGREGGPQFIGPEDGDGKGEPDNEYEQALRDAGLLDGPPPTGYYREWLENAERQGVPPETIVDIARRHNITPDSFTVLDGMEKVTDPDGKSYFLMPPGTSGEDARKAALMTYILNCGTDYGENPQTDFPETPYSADEVQRIIDRQNANAWSYNRDVDFVHDNGGRLMTTPNGMLMGLGGNQYQDMFSEGGGSTWGDIFMVNIDDPSDPAQTLRDMVDDGVMWYPTEGGEGAPGNNRLDLDRILHHEEIHSQQWQQKGYLGFIDAYLTGKLVEIFTDHPMEKDAGLSDGGYQ
ncbi:protein of unknown function [Mycolicibacterium rutilum]|uniref:ESX-1 secretion-associated protein EspA/EspE-like domain-containing protein n=1 Tax=Mycolicibacterium rutilum TaxID=370526 RepID=A0A1H6JRF9_MYCRU|nr:protein of unknown function [Mycolicibacterium rutilum]